MTLLKLYAHGSFIGVSNSEVKLASFCDAIANGRDPDPEYLRLVAKALSGMVLGKGSTEERAMNAAKVLGLNKKQGKARTAALKARELGWSVLEYQDLAEVHGEVEAVRMIAIKHGITVRAMQDRVRKYVKQANENRSIRAASRQLMATLESSGSEA